MMMLFFENSNDDAEAQSNTFHNFPDNCSVNGEDLTRRGG
jgi:hypothetical protein